MSKLSNFKLSHKLTNSNDVNMFILISLLHANGFINKESLKAKYKLLRTNKLLRTVGTYHSKLTNEWYNDEYILDVFDQIFERMKNPTDPRIRLRHERMNKLLKISGLEIKKFKNHLDFEETLKYLNLYLNKNRNYCINWIYNNIISDLINQYDAWHSSNNFRNLTSLFDHDFSNIEKYHYDYSTYGYCCEDCDGPLDMFLSYRWKDIHSRSKKEIIEMVEKFLDSKRKDFYNTYRVKNGVMTKV